MDNVEFPGIYLHQDSAAIFAGIDVLVVPSIWYDFPLIIYEAFATNTPVLATNLGGMAESVTHDVNGLLFERGDVSGLAMHMRRMLEERDLLDRLKAGIPGVKTVKEELDELEWIYHQLARQDSRTLLHKG